LRAFDTEEHARRFGDALVDHIRALSRYIDLQELDGVTVAFDYAQALLDFDRGYETSHKLVPSSDIALGVAMTPSVKRDGRIKSHMLFYAETLLPLEDDKDALYEQALHLLGHECAHVEVTAVFNSSFPGVLLQAMTSDFHDHLRWGVIFSCWDEYAVTRICAPIG
jgi:hypothetical protein